jgi:hypothetical protein
LTFCSDNHVMAIKENGLGMGFSDQWSFYGDQRYVPNGKQDRDANLAPFMSSFGFGRQFGDAFQFLHYSLAQSLRPLTRRGTDFEDRTVPVQLFQ